MEVYINRALNINSNRSPEKPAEEQSIIPRSAEPVSDDEAFLEEIYCRYYKNVYNYISFRINNHCDAEELTDTVFEKAVRGLRTYRPELSPAEAWLIGIAKNTVTDYLRGKKRKIFVPFDFFSERTSPSGRPDEIIVVKEENRALIRAMNRLKDKERQILSMKFATDLKNTEIARILGIGESNVGVIIHRSLKKLKNILETESGMYDK